MKFPPKYLLRSASFIMMFLFFVSAKQKTNPVYGCSTAEADAIYTDIKLQDAGLSLDAFEKAIKGYNKLDSLGQLSNCNIISIADFSQSGNNKRLYVIDLTNRKILFQTYCAHGKYSGAEFANYFSNVPGSKKSCLGFFVTMNSYYGDCGYGMRLKGVEYGFNNNAYYRNIVMHGSNYASENWIETYGTLGRSWGCPAVPPQEVNSIIDEIKDGSCFFIYYPDPYYLAYSKFAK